MSGQSHARRLELLVEQYVDVRRRRHDFISVELALKAIRQVAMNGISDEAIADLVAHCALKRGLEVRFDHAGPGITSEAA